FIDEANLTASNWTVFEGLFQTAPGLLIDEDYCPLTPEHKVVFAGNPVSYGDGRKLASLFVEHGNTVVFEPLPEALLYEDVLKPLFDELGIMPALRESAVTAFFAVYRFLVACSTTDVLISPRELQMMALLTLSHCQRYPLANIQTVAKHYAHTLAKNLAPAAHRAEFDQLFKPLAPLPFAKILDADDFLMTPSRQDLGHLFQALLDLRSMRQAKAKQVLNSDSPSYKAFQFGGLGALIVDGEPGIGKTELVINMLECNGFKQQTNLRVASVHKKPFYHLAVNSSFADKERLLLKAFDEGAVVVIDEINSSFMMEQLLNDLLMGKAPNNAPPKTPGFMIIGTQNPITMAGRRAPSTALLRRCISETLPTYPDEELHNILRVKNATDTDAIELVAAFNKNREHAKINRLSPAPSCRDLFNFTDKAVNEQQQAVAAQDVMPLAAKAKVSRRAGLRFFNAVKEQQPKRPLMIQDAPIEESVSHATKKRGKDMLGISLKTASIRLASKY
ncbi:MAG: AAA family ATPase, partial [Legionellales bacterium]